MKEVKVFNSKERKCHFSNFQGTLWIFNSLSRSNFKILKKAKRATRDEESLKKKTIKIFLIFIRIRKDSKH